jgi:hypothetical protein
MLQAVKQHTSMKEITGISRISRSSTRPVSSELAMTKAS